MKKRINDCDASSKAPTDDCFNRPINRLNRLTAILLSLGQGVETLL